MKEKLTGVVAIGTAMLSSACCIVPVLAATLGLGTVGVSSYFDELRPYLLLVTFLVLGFSFYLVFFNKRKIDCADGSCKTEGSTKISKIILWVALVFVSIFTMLPY